MINLIQLGQPVIKTGLDFQPVNDQAYSAWTTSHKNWLGILTGQ